MTHIVASDPQSPLLQLSGISKSFGGVRALRGVDFRLDSGQVHALLGENGAGKSTLIKIISGAHQPDSGTFTLAGKSVEENSPARARQLGIAVIYQQPALFADLSIAENIALRIQPPGAWRRIDWTARRANAARLLRRVGAEIDPDTRVRSLTMPQQQLVEIAAALGADARVLILDEPTASLGERDARNLFGVIGDLKRQGVGIVYISHRLDEILQIADHLTVLRDGQHVASRPAAGITPAEMIRLMVGRSLEAVFHKVNVPIGEVVLEVRGLTCRAAGIEAVSLNVRAGEIVALAGLVGAGRTELARTLFGLTPADSGQILVHGKQVTLRTPADAIRHGIAYLPEDRRRHGVILDLPVDVNTTLAVLDRISNWTLIDFDEERKIAGDFVNQMATKTAALDTPVGNLSGGNQQKVALSRWLATKPAVVILDEPTQGVDVGAKSEIHRLIGTLAGQGLAVILISSELPEVLGVSDRIAVMRSGGIIATFERGQATPEQILELALPTDAGPSTEAA